MTAICLVTRRPSLCIKVIDLCLSYVALKVFNQLKEDNFLAKATNYEQPGTKVIDLCLSYVASTVFNPLKEHNLLAKARDYYGKPERVFFQKSETFRLGQTNWGEMF